MDDYSKPKVPSINAEEVSKAIEENINIILLDVRTTGEYSRGKIKGSINIPLDEVSLKIEATIPDKKSIVYVYCLSGSRSVYAVDTMIKLGYANVYDMTNGLLAWRAKGFITE
jgi:rhodanese-related sulfurtransferase